MPPVYTYDHIHLRSTNPQATIEYYQKMFDATLWRMCNRMASPAWISISTG